MIVHCVLVIKIGGPVVAKFYHIKPKDGDEAKELLRPLLNINWDDYYCVVTRASLNFESLIETLKADKKDESNEQTADR